MKRDNDLVREILLALEAQSSDPGDWIEHERLLPNRDPQTVSYHVWLLSDGGYITADSEARDCFSNAYKFHDPKALTYKGCEFLDAIRDAEIWRQAKDAAKKGGGASVEFLWEIAKAYLKKQLEEKAGIEVAD